MDPDLFNSKVNHQVTLPSACGNIGLLLNGVESEVQVPRSTGQALLPRFHETVLQV